MSDRWENYVREHLPDLRVDPAREAEIVSELAQQLDQAYRDALSSGSSEPDAIHQAQAQFTDWNKLAREIESAEQRPIDAVLPAGPLVRRVARSSLRRSIFSPQSSVCRGCGNHAGLRNRRQHRGLHHGRRACSPRPTLYRPRSFDGHRHDEKPAGIHRAVDLRARFLRPPRPNACVLFRSPASAPSGT